MALTRGLRRSRSLAALVALVAISLVVAACVTAPTSGEALGGGSSATRSAAPSQTAAAGEAPTPGSSASAPVTPASSVDPTASATPTQPPRSAEPSIGYISLDESQAFVNAVSGGIRESARSAGFDLVECDSGWTRAGVMSCAEKLGQAGVHGAISFQPFSDLGAEVCAALGDVPVVGIVYDQGPCQVSSLQIDQSESGRLAGAALGQFASDRWKCEVKAYLSLESSADDPIGGARMQGYRDGYQEHCPLPAQTRTLRDAQHLITAQTQVARQLARIGGKPILVAGVSDIAILGAIEAAEVAGRQNHLWYSGQLADPAIRQTIACDKHYIASVAQFPERFGSALVPTLVAAVDGQDVPPLLDAELQLVTAENVRTLFPDTLACGG